MKQSWYESWLFFANSQANIQNIMYLENIQHRFPQLLAQTCEEIWGILENNNNRSNYVSEFELHPGVCSIEHDLLNIETLFDKYPSIQDAINYTIKQKEWLWHIVMWYYTQKIEWRTQTVGPISIKPIQFITKESDKIWLSDVNQVLLTIQVSPNWCDDFGRPSYKIKPKLVEVSSETILMPKWTTFEKEISEKEFYTYLDKLEVVYI